MSVRESKFGTLSNKDVTKNNNKKETIFNYMQYKQLLWYEQLQWTKDCKTTRE